MTNIADICSILIASCALFVSVYTVYIQKHHDERNIMPICFIAEKFHLDNLAVLINNLGLGAMTIDEIDVRKDGLTRDNLIEFLPKVDQKWEGFSLEIAGRTILPTQQIVLFAIKPKNDNTRNEIIDALFGIEIKIKYHDVYGKKYVIEKTLRYGAKINQNFGYVAK